jgi:hypothetical protein
LDYPEGGRNAEAHSNDYRRSEDGNQQTPSPPRVESDPRPNRASLTTWNGKGDGKCHRDHRKGNGDQRCDPGVRQRERNGKRQPVRDAQVHDNLT